MPYWGLALIGTTVLFIAPLVYKTNKELIDQQLQQATDLVNAQTNQLREVANKHTAHATEVTKQYMGDYTAKAQQMLGGRSTKTSVASAPAAPTTDPKTLYSETDFPAAPKEDLKTEAATSAETEPLIST